MHQLTILTVMPASHVLIWLESKQPWFRLYSMRTFAKWLNQSLTWQEEAQSMVFEL
ncbi:hypothetical protein BTN50_1731 (plasmid) [Candidatus Enterovibrio altilux]|uniref:Uncharacterized protein n=1 Tax=Candidatus Enterovibrio altilux TaxID=1927128 RepID=A0A291BB18_9GAMM|nr:hypothetical protein BTN50_1731 [Candidatus Enterovibrio luxaltus]